MKRFFGLDLGGTKLAGGIINEDGGIVKKRVIPANTNSLPGLISDIEGLFQSLCAECGLSFKDISAVGMGSPGAVDPKNGVIIYANNLGFQNASIKEGLKPFYDGPVYLENDANCAALGESLAGAAKGHSFSITITLGTGIGSGMVFDNKIYQSNYPGSGEFGHTVIHVGGEACSCGRNGCFEAYCSATALIRDTKRALAQHPDSLIASLCAGDPDKITAKTPFDGALAKDPASIEIIERFMLYLAEGLSNLVNIFRPDAIVVGGGVGDQGEKLLGPVREMMKQLCYGHVMEAKLLHASLGNDAGLVGAALLGR